MKAVKGNLKYLLFFVLASSIYFWDVIFKGVLLVVEDGLDEHYPIFKLVAQQYRHGIFPFWNPGMFSGFPLMAANQGGVFYPPTVILAFLFKAPAAFNINIMLHFALAGFFTFLYASRIGLGKASAVWAGLAFCFLGYLPAHINYEPVILCGAWLPAVLYLCEGLLEDIGPGRAAFLALAVSMQVFAGHPQIFFYSLLAVIFYAAFRSTSLGQGRRLRFAGYMALALALAAVITLPQTFASWQLSRMGARGAANYELFSMGSFAPRDLPSVLFPALYHQWIEAFVGLPTLFLAAWGVFAGGRGSKLPVFWAAVVVLGIMLSFGAYLAPLNRILFRLPLYSSFRGAAKHWFEVSFAFSILSAFGMKAIFAGGREKLSVKYISFIAAAGCLCGLAYFLFGGNVNAKNLLASMPVVFICVYVLVFLLMRKYPAVRYILFLVIFVEAVSYRMDYKFPRANDVGAANAGLYRVIRAHNEGRTAFLTAKPRYFMLGMSRGVMAINGYDPLFTYQYARLLNMGIQGFSFEWPQLLQNNLVLSLLNTKYIVAPDSLAIANPAYKKIYVDGGLAAYENLNALPRAYAVTGLVPVDSIEDFKQAVYAGRVDPRREAGIYMDDLASIGSASFAAGQVNILFSSPLKTRIGTDFPGRGFVVLADQYYPGWKAYIDGARAAIYRADGLLRGVVVPPGRHMLVFAYRPYKIYLAMLLAALALAAVVVMIFVHKTKTG